jgi:hypothetical protein
MGRKPPTSAVGSARTQRVCPRSLVKRSGAAKHAAMIRLTTSTIVLALLATSALAFDQGRRTPHLEFGAPSPDGYFERARPPRRVVPCPAGTAESGERRDLSCYPVVAPAPAPARPAPLDE